MRYIGATLQGPQRSGPEICLAEPEVEELATTSAGRPLYIP